MSVRQRNILYVNLVAFTFVVWFYISNRIYNETIRANGANGKKRPQSIFIEFHWLQEYIWLKPPSNSFKVDYLLCVGQTPNIALSISPSPATTQKTEKKVTYYWPSKILELRLSLWKQAGRWLKLESYCLALKLRETYSMFQAVKRPVEIVKRWLNFKAIFLGEPKREKLHIVYVEHTHVYLSLEQINTFVL